MNYKYNLSINQRAIIEAGLPLDFTEAHIFYLLIDFINTVNFKKVEVNGKYYTYITWKKIVEQLPMLGITTRQKIIQRINKLISLNLLEKIVLHGNTPYYCAGINAELLTGGCNQNVTGGVTEKLQGCNQKVTGGVTKTLHNNNTNNNLTNNITKNKSENINTHTGVNLDFYKSVEGKEKIRQFAKTQLTELIPKLTAGYVNYTPQQIEDWIAATMLGITNIDFNKCEFSPTGEILQTDLVQHVVNIAIKQLREVKQLKLPLPAKVTNPEPAKKSFWD